MTLRQHLEGQIAAGHLRFDPVQNTVIDALDTVLAALPMTRKRTSFLTKVTKRSVLKNRFNGIYLHGPVGRGKTMLMDAFLTQLPPQFRVLRTHFHRFMRDTHAYLHARRKAQDADDILADYIAGIASQYDMLAFDEFHVTDIADAMILGRLLRGLFAAQVQVMLTSNFAPQDLYKGGLQRDRFLPVIDAIRVQMQVMTLDGPHDYRRDRVAVDDIYLTPLGPATTARLDAIFARLTDDADPHSTDLPVQGRILHLPCTARGAARVSFAAMCEVPLGASDYLALAQAFDTVLLEGVPHLTQEKRNEAKRLMTLIDVLYDQKTLLIVSAAALPDALYDGLDHGFEFQRTASRLMEMQSPAYLAMINET
jgi:cell division protein ZapE